MTSTIPTDDPDVNLIILSYLSHSAITTLEQVDPDLSAGGLGQRIWHARLYQSMKGENDSGSKWDYSKMPFRHGADYRRMYRVLHDHLIRRTYVTDDEDVVLDTRLQAVATTLLEALRDDVLGTRHSDRVGSVDKTSRYANWDREVSEVLLAYIDAVATSYDQWEGLSDTLMRVAITVVAPYLATEIIDRGLTPPLCLHQDEIEGWYGANYIYSPERGRWTHFDSTQGRMDWEDSYEPDWEYMRMIQLSHIISAYGHSANVSDTESDPLYPSFYGTILERYHLIIEEAISIATSTLMAGLDLSAALHWLADSFMSGGYVAAIITHGPEVLETLMQYPSLVDVPLAPIVLSSLSGFIKKYDRRPSLRDVVDCLDLIAKKWGMHITDSANPRRAWSHDIDAHVQYGLAAIDSDLAIIYSNCITNHADALYYLRGLERLWRNGVAAWDRPLEHGVGIAIAGEVDRWMAARKLPFAARMWVGMCKDMLLGRRSTSLPYNPFSVNMLNTLLATALLVGREGDIRGILDTIPHRNDYIISAHLYAMFLVYVAWRLMPKVDCADGYQVLESASVKRVDRDADQYIKILYRYTPGGKGRHDKANFTASELVRELCRWLDVGRGAQQHSEIVAFPPCPEAVLLATRLAIARNVFGREDVVGKHKIAKMLVDAADRGDTTRMRLCSDVSWHLEVKVASILATLLSPEAVRVLLDHLELYGGGVTEEVAKAADVAWDVEVRNAMKKWLASTPARKR